MAAERRAYPMRAADPKPIDVRRRGACGTMPVMASVRDRVLAQVDALADETAAFTTELVRIPTVNPTIAPRIDPNIAARTNTVTSVDHGPPHLGPGITMRPIGRINPNSTMPYARFSPNLHRRAVQCQYSQSWR